MADQSKELGVSVAYISAIERGSRAVPPRYAARLIDWLRLSEEDAKELHELANSTTKVVELLPADEERAALAVDLAQNFNQIPIQELRRLRTLGQSEKSTNSADDIRKAALLAREYFGLANKFAFDLLEILENKLVTIDPTYSLSVRTNEEIGGDGTQAHTEAVADIIRQVVFSEYMYDVVHRQKPEGRYVAAHELAHWLLHARARPFLSSPLARRITRDSRLEREADQFAREFLLPENVVRSVGSAGQLAMLCNVPLWVAVKRIAELRAEETRSKQRNSVDLSPRFSDLLAYLRRDEKLASPRTQSAQITSQPRNLVAQNANVVLFPNDTTPRGKPRVVRKRPARVERDNSLPLLEFAKRVGVAARSETKLPYKSMLSALGYYSGHNHQPQLDNQPPAATPHQAVTTTRDRNASWFRTYGWRG